MSASPTARTGLVVARRIGIALAFIAILLQPGFGQAKVPTRVADIEVLVVVDRTRSMAALDYDGEPRLDGVRADLEALAEALPTARIGLLTYGFDVQLELPFTNDINAFTAAVDTLRLESPTGGAGSSVDRPKAQLLDVLERAEQQYPDRRRMLVFVSDGERTTDGDPSSLAEVADHVAGGAVLGYGTTDGARMPAADDLSDKDGYVQDPATDQDAISRADPDALRELADQFEVPYVDRSAPGKGESMAKVAKSFKASYTPEGAEDAERAAHDLTWVAGLVLLALVLLELRAGWQAVWTSRSVLGGRR